MASPITLRLAFVPLALAFCFSGCDVRIGTWRMGGPAIKGNGVLTTEERTVDEFSTIEVSGSVQIEVKLGSEPGVSVTVDENLQEIIETKVIDGRLIVRSTESFSTNNPILVKASTNLLTSYKGSGATTGSIEGLEAESSFKADVSGASSLKIGSGSTQKLSVEASGASTFKALELTAEDANVHASGASTIWVNATKTLSAHASGASNVRYNGSPEILAKNASGASSIEPN